MAERLVGSNYTTPDLVAKVTGRARYAEDFRAEGMLFCKLLISPMPHARVRRIDASRALALPGVHGLITADDLPDLGGAERALTNEPLYQGEPILALAAVSEDIAAEAIELIDVDFEPLPFTVDPIESLPPGRARCASRGQRLGRRAAPGRRASRRPAADRAAQVDARPTSPPPTDGQLPMGTAMEEWQVRRPRRRLRRRRAGARRDLHGQRHRPPSDGDAQRHGLLARRHALPALLHAERHPHGGTGGALGRHRSVEGRAHLRVHRRRLRQQGLRRGLDGDPGRALEEGQRAGDDAGEPRGGELLRPRPHQHDRPRQDRLRQGRPHPGDGPLRRPGQRALRPDGRLALGRQRRVAGLPAAGDAHPRRQRLHQHAAAHPAALARADAVQRHRRRRADQGGQAAAASIRWRCGASTRPRARRCTARRPPTGTPPLRHRRVRQGRPRPRRRALRLDRRGWRGRGSAAAPRRAASAWPSGRTAPARSASTG